MKKIFFLIISFSTLLIFLLFSSVFLSCKKDSDKTTKDENTGENVQTSSEFTETNEDLLTVDYSYFYKELSGKGEWIEMSSKDLGLDIKQSSLFDVNSERHKFISKMLGIKTAYAQTSEDIFNIFVWRPVNELASNMTEENKEKQYEPYNNGQWVYTDDGWYFKANTPEEEITSHYGRWTQDPNLGWVWLPGKVWAPAWVDWREDADYVAWTPIQPGTYIQNDNIKSQTILNENKYTIVEKNHLWNHRYISTGISM